MDNINTRSTMTLSGGGPTSVRGRRACLVVHRISNSSVLFKMKVPLFFLY